MYSLEQFGPVGTTAQADATLRKASEEIIAHGGGMLIIPKTAPAVWVPQNTSQGEWRKPEPPAPTKSWGPTRAVTLLDYRDGTLKVYVPQATGMDFERTFLLPEGQSSPHWEMHPLLNLKNTIVRGSTSYREWLLEDVKAGPDRRFYVRTIRGVFPGEFLNTGDSGQVVRINVKSLGYDTDRKLPYFVADTDIDVHHGALIHNKTHVNQIRLETYSHTENQTFDVMNWRYDYSQGDTYLYDGRFHYMSDVHSTAGDENGVIYAAFSVSDVTPFHGKVESWDPKTLELKYTGAQNAHTLGTGRPLINLNPAKCITAGKAYILEPSGATLGWGGHIRSTDASWTADVVGRYFAVNEPDERVPGSNQDLRWWLITAFSEAKGVKEITVQRHWWGAKNGSISRLYNPYNFTGDETKPRLLGYIIAPGANVFDVARGTADGAPFSGGARDRIIRVAPGPDLGAAMDFARDDPIVQAIGPDPFKPIPFRAWMSDSVPGSFGSPVFDIANLGMVSRYSVMTVNGGGGDVTAYQDRARPLPHLPWNSVLNIQSATDNGIVFRGDVLNAALLFRQPHDRPQWISWGGKSRISMGVSSEGDLVIGATRVDVANQGVSAVGGLSGDRRKGVNFRGIGIAVAKGAKTCAVVFANPEPSDVYAVIIQPSWLTAHAITKPRKEGFTVEFNRVAPDGATLNWMIVR